MGAREIPRLEISETHLRDLVRRSDLNYGEWRELGSRVVRGEVRELPGADSELTAALSREPHFLGWLHQHLLESGRAEAFDAHHHLESKHADATTTTQLYTPRWVADRLAVELMQASHPEATCLDPACGGGQMLLAWVDAAIDAGVAPRTAFSRIRGHDLDPRAVATCREVLKLHARRVLGASRSGVEAELERQITTRDSLFDEVEGADVVLMNPPYMGSRSMPDDLKSQIREHFEPFHQDLYTAFIARARQLAGDAIGVLAQQTIWYLSRYRKAREDLLERGSLRFFAHLGPGVFASLTGEKASVVAFVQSFEEGGQGCRFVDLREASRENMALRLDSDRGVERDLAEFREIPGTPIAHWLEPELVAHFGSTTLGEVVEIPGGQNKTGANKRFVKHWGDVDDLHPTPFLHEGDGVGRWRFYSKGGPFAPWWGNWNWVVDWSDEAREFYRTNKTSNLVDQAWVDRPGLVYSDFGGRRFAARYKPRGVVFDMTGPAIFVPDDDEDLLFGLLVLLNSTSSRKLLNAMNPSLHYQVRDLRNLPLVDSWHELALQAAGAGRELVDAYRELHRGVEGDPLHDGSIVTLSAEIRGLEADWNGRISLAHGIEPGESPTHHVID